MRSAPSSGADGGAAGSSSLSRSSRSFVGNLEHAAAGDPDAAQRMRGALQRSALRDDRLDRIPDSRSAQRRHEALRAAERALIAVAWYRQRFEERERVCRAV